MHVFSRTERVAQLRALQDTCIRLAQILAEHDEPRTAHDYLGVAAAAAALLDQNFTKPDLNEVASALPPAPSWLHPRAVDGSPLEPWQEEVSRLCERAWENATDLRAVAKV